MDTEQIKAHVDNCPRCKHAAKIGRLCPVGRRYLDKELMALLPYRIPATKVLNTLPVIVIKK